MSASACAGSSTTEVHRQFAAIPSTGVSELECLPLWGQWIDYLRLGVMTARTRKRFLVVMAATAGVAVLLLHYKERDSYRCQVCFATKEVLQWRLGLGAASLPLTPAWERVTATRFLHDFLPANHTHDWALAQGSPYYFFGTTWGGCTIGGGRYMNHLCWMYESDPQFRTFIQRNLLDGSLAKSNVIALMSSPRTDATSPLQKEADELLARFSGR